MKSFRPLSITILVASVAIQYCAAQIDGNAAYEAFLKWRKTPENSELGWDAALAKYGSRLRASGEKADIVERTLLVISARDEATLYDPIFAKPPKFDPTPNHFLVEATRGRAPGTALDVGMGQGRNAVYLATIGWKVTGFDVSKVGLDEARRQAASAGVSINTVQMSDVEFDFGTHRWDLIAIIYPIEKRSVYKARQALKPGGVVVIECGHKASGQAPYLYDSNELLHIFEGFHILKYEEPVAMHDWARREMRLVRLIAEKP
jgi:2-polyprenyl-3-methyl-5-hydroxy-6-metoxy-1,4-benzoquinol methylase